jgi:AcrR family transcriptional regulator
MSPVSAQRQRSNGRVEVSVGTTPREPRRTLRGLQPQEVRAIQRVRILAAVAQLACERGLDATTVSQMVSRAGVSRRTFYELFEDRHACLLGIFEETVARAGAAVAEAYRAEARWVDRVRAALLALLQFIESEPELASVSVVQALVGADARLLARREEVLAVVTAALDEGRRGAPAAQPLPLTAEGAVGAVLSILHARLQDERRPPLADLLSPLMGILVLPYLGQAAARRELARPAPELAAPARSSDPGARASSDPLAGLKMRVTYRTLRVLGVIAARPGINNREVASASGITDPGQVSKLLSRLRGLGLVENRRPGAGGGARNGWLLTAAGERVWRATTVGARQGP